MCKFGIDTLRYFSYTYPLVVLIYASDIVADYVCVCVCVCVTMSIVLLDCAFSMAHPTASLGPNTTSSNSRCPISICWWWRRKKWSRAESALGECCIREIHRRIQKFTAWTWLAVIRNKWKLFRFHLTDICGSSQGQILKYSIKY